MMKDEYGHKIGETISYRNRGGLICNGIILKIIEDTDDFTISELSDGTIIQTDWYNGEWPFEKIMTTTLTITLPYTLKHLRLIYRSKFSVPDHMAVTKQMIADWLGDVAEREVRKITGREAGKHDTGSNN